MNKFLVVLLPLLLCMQVSGIAQKANANKAKVSKMLKQFFGEADALNSSGMETYIFPSRSLKACPDDSMPDFLLDPGAIGYITMATTQREEISAYRLTSKGKKGGMFSDSLFVAFVPLKDNVKNDQRSELDLFKSKNRTPLGIMFETFMDREKMGKAYSKNSENYAAIPVIKTAKGLRVYSPDRCKM